MNDLRLISADSHVNEPGDLWVERIDTQFRDRAPRVVENPPGLKPGAYLTLEGIPPIHLAQTGCRPALRRAAPRGSDPWFGHRGRVGARLPGSRPRATAKRN